MTPKARFKVVTYHRISTMKQENSGLGLAAQEDAIEAFVKQRGATVVGTFTERESGKNNERPELAKALHLAKLTRATLVISKLDRLSRSAAFLLTLRDSGVKFLAVDMPDANELTVGILAVVAQAEREAISKRTKEALAAAKARGATLGNPYGARALRRAGKGNADAVKAIKARANSRAQDLKPVIEALKKEGFLSLGAMAGELNSRGFVTERGSVWHKTSVKRVLARI